MTDIVSLLCSKAKLERDKGVEELGNFLNIKSEDDVVRLQGHIIDLVLDPAAVWEVYHGALMALRAIFMHEKWPCDGFAEIIRAQALVLLEHEEGRVRIAAGETMGALCKRFGPDVYEASKFHIVNGIKDNLERKGEENDCETFDVVEELSRKMQGDKPQLKRRLSKEDIFHDTAGWKSLETWMKCLQYCIDGCGTSFNRFVNPDLLDLIGSTLTHTNRFVRETAFYVCGSLVGCNYSESGEMLVSLEENMIYQHGIQFAKQLAHGLSDNWSQVRLAASTASRNFLMGLPTEDTRQQFYSILLPPLCLNRYYVAAGVRIYNQETWKLVTQGDGKNLVEKYIENVVSFYVSQSEADNHAVREAACACIAELGYKIDKSVVSPYIETLLDALVVCFKDDSWPVRDASCLASGNFVACFPEESRSTMPTLFPLFFQNLVDNIPSVRQGAAAALANVVRAYGSGMLGQVISKIHESLIGVEHQSADTERYSDLEKGPATFGVVKKRRDNDAELHENNTMYSCGSLAPKMGRGKKGAGCLDHAFQRPAEPWEAADGCVILMGELAQVPVAVPEVMKLLPLLAKSAGYRHYTQHSVFLETLCKELPRIAKGLGNKQFKTYLETFFDAIFYSATCHCELTQVAGQQCLDELSHLLGPSILRGRVENYDPKYLDLLRTPGSPGTIPDPFLSGPPSDTSTGIFRRPFAVSHDPFGSSAAHVTRISGQLKPPQKM